MLSYFVFDLAVGFGCGFYMWTRLWVGLSANGLMWALIVLLVEVTILWRLGLVVAFHGFGAVFTDALILVFI